MNFREARKPILLGVSGVIILVALISIFRTLTYNPVQFVSIKKQFYTVDDGVTRFADDANKLVPFEHDGQEAVLAHVFKTQSGLEYVGWLERCSPKGIALIKKFEEQAASEQDPNIKMMLQENIQSVRYNEREVKKPGEGKWVLGEMPAGMKITEIVSPDGSPVISGVLPK